MMYSFFAQVSSKAITEIEMHAFILFKDLDFKRFTDKIVEKIESMHGYKTEEDYDSLAKESAEKCEDPKLKKVHAELVKGNLQKFDMEFEEYITSLPGKLPEELKKEKEIMSRLENIRIPDRDGLLEERYIRYLLGRLATALIITALNMTKSGKKLIKKEQEADVYPGKSFYARKSFLAMHFLGETSEELKQYEEKCSKPTKDDVRRLGKELSVFSPHKIGWLDNAAK